jgi:GntR family transcriptional regulator
MTGQMTLQAELDRPLYLQLADRLRQEVAGRPPGERIDSEAALAERFGVSRFTVTRAIEILVDEGLVRRKQGLGSFVAPPPLLRQPGYLASFSETVTAQGHVAAHRLIAFGDASWREGAPFEPGEKLVRLDRLRLVDDIPTAIHSSLVSAALASRIGLTRAVARAADFSLYRLFASAGLAVACGVETLRARAATAEEARRLGLGDCLVVMEVTRFSYDASGALLDYVHAVYDSRRYAYRAELLSAGLSGAPGARSEEKPDASEPNARHDFGPRLDFWGDEPRSGGEAGRAHHRAGRPRRSVL